MGQRDKIQVAEVIYLEVWGFEILDNGYNHNNC